MPGLFEAFVTADFVPVHSHYFVGVPRLFDALVIGYSVPVHSHYSDGEPGLFEVFVSDALAARGFRYLIALRYLCYLNYVVYLLRFLIHAYLSILPLIFQSPVPLLLCLLLTVLSLLG